MATKTAAKITKPAVAPPPKPAPKKASTLKSSGTAKVNSKPVVPVAAKTPTALAGNVLANAAQAAINGAAAKTASAMNSPLPGATDIMKSGIVGAATGGVTAPSSPSAPASFDTSSYVSNSPSANSTGSVVPTIAPTIAPPAPIAAPAVPIPTTVGPGDQNTTAQSFDASGQQGTVGRLNRLRNVRGPGQGLSVTPELLRRAAQSKFSRAF